MAWIVSVLNLANTIIGVSVLSMPFLLQNCGVALGLLLMYISGYLTIQSCSMLLKSAHITGRPTYELLAQYLFGGPGKLLMEISNIGVLFGASIGMFVIIGDVAPATIISLFALDWDRFVLRQYTLIVMGITVVLPMSLLRDIRKLSVAAGLSMIVYFALVSYLMVLSFPKLLSFQWIHKIVYYDLSGVLRCVPILALAFACQTTLFLVLDSHHDKSTMGSVAKAAVSFCGMLYASVGFFGYMAYYDRDIPGDILLSFLETKMAFVLKLLFALTVVASIPLCVFSGRNSLDSLITTYFVAPVKPVINGPARIPTRRFVAITASFVGLALLIALYIPNVELVLQLTGATMGSLIAFIFPGAYYLKATDTKASKRRLALFILCLGLFLMVVSTWVIVTQSRVESPVQELSTTHMTKVTTSETEAPVSKSEPTPIVENGSQDRDLPVVPEPGGNEGKTVKEKEDIVKSKPEVTEQEKKGLVKEGSRQEPPVPLDVKEDSEERKEVEKPKESELHEKALQGKEADESRVGHDAQVPGKKVVVDEEEQKKLLDRLDILEQKVIKLSDDKKKEEGESEADNKDTGTTDLQQHNKEATTDNGTHRVHGTETHVTKNVNRTLEQIALQRVGEEGHVKPVSHPVPDGGVGATKDEDRSKRVVSDRQTDRSLEGGPPDRENGPDVDVDDSHEGKEKRGIPEEEDSLNKQGDTHEREALEADDPNPPVEKQVAGETQGEHSVSEKPQERTKREETPEQVNIDISPSEATQDPSLTSQSNSEGERKGKLQQNTNTLTDGTTENSDL